MGNSASTEPTIVPATIGQLLAQKSLEHPNRELLRFNGNSISVGNANEQSNRIAHSLLHMGVKLGDRVAVMLPNGFEFPLTWFAIAKLGAVIVPLNPSGGINDLGHVLQDSSASVAISNPEGIEKLKQLSDAAALKLVCWGSGSSDVTSLDKLVNEMPATWDEKTEVVGETLLNLQYTSGTTGFPRGCMLSHAYWLTLAARSAKLIEAQPSDVLYTCQPFYYMDPQWNTVLCLAAGLPLVVGPRFSASTFWKTICDEGVTFFYCIGTMPIILSKLPVNAATERNHRLRVVYCSGIYPLLHQQFEERFNVPWREVFGMTETGVDIAMPVSATNSVGSGLIGFPVSGKQAAVVDTNGTEVKRGDTGELVLRGGPMMHGYWNRPDETAQIFRDGWLHTGDVARQNDSGAFQLVGRLKDMIRRAGENIAAVEVEEALCGHADVLQAAVTATPDDTTSEEVMAWLRVAKVSSPESLKSVVAAVHAYAATRLAQFKVPRYWFIVDEFPLTASERVAKHRLHELFPTAVTERIDLGKNKKS
jgi:acyl-CoA synthetase (AMP-forming)/AMP-acid ligase II